MYRKNPAIMSFGISAFLRADLDIPHLLLVFFRTVQITPTSRLYRINEKQSPDINQAGGMLLYAKSMALLSFMI